MDNMVGRCVGNALMPPFLIVLKMVDENHGGWLGLLGGGDATLNRFMIHMYDRQ